MPNRRGERPSKLRRLCRANLIAALALALLVLAALALLGLLPSVLAFIF